MKDNSIAKSFLLPAALVFATVFTTSNLAFESNKDNPLLTKMLLMGSRELKPTVIGADGNLMLRYVGFTIVVSVGSGVATVEVMRRLKLWGEVKKKQSRSQEHEKTQHLLSADNRLTPQFAGKTETIFHLQHGDIAIDSGGAMELANSECTCSDNDCSLHSHSIELRQYYQHCWVRVPYLERRLFAIVADGFYYCFVRVEKTPEKAANLVARLSHRNEQAVVTRTHHGYAVWVWKPDAYPDLVA